MLLTPWSMAQAQQFVEDSLNVDGYMRRFDLFLPEGIKTDAPLVFYLHGYGGAIYRKNPMIETASREGFAVCIPQGLKDPKGKPSWNVGYPFQQGWKVDDVKSLSKIAAYVQKRYRLSRDNTFLTGMSNGGEMCYLMAYSRQKAFKAVAPIAGLTMAWMYRHLEGGKPIPLFEIHGTEDRRPNIGMDGRPRKQRRMGCLYACAAGRRLLDCKEPLHKGGNRTCGKPKQRKRTLCHQAPLHR